MIMYIQDNISKNTTNDIIIKKINVLLRKGYTMQEILDRFMNINSSFFNLVFGKMLCAYFEEAHKTIPKDVIDKRDTGTFFRKCNLYEWFCCDKQLNKKYNNNFEAFAQNIYKHLYPNEKIPDNIKDFFAEWCVEIFDIDLYLMQAMYAKKDTKDIYFAIIEKENAELALASIWNEFKKSASKINKDNVLDKDIESIYKKYNSLFALEALYQKYNNMEEININNYLIEKYKEFNQDCCLDIHIKMGKAFIDISDYQVNEEGQTYYETFISNYYSYIKGRSLSLLPLSIADTTFLTIVEGNKDVKKALTKNISLLGDFCISYLEYTSDLDFPIYRDIQEKGRKSTEYKILQKKLLQK